MREGGEKGIISVCNHKACRNWGVVRLQLRFSRTTLYPLPLLASAQRPRRWEERGGENCTLDLKGVMYPSFIYDSAKCASDFLGITTRANFIAPLVSAQLFRYIETYAACRAHANEWWIICAVLTLAWMASFDQGAARKEKEKEREREREKNCRQSDWKLVSREFW